MKSYHLYVGTYGQHIHVLSYDAENGMLSEGFSSFVLDEDRPVCLVFEQKD